MVEFRAKSAHICFINQKHKKKRTNIFTMKNKFLSTILNFITELFYPLYEAAERNFTLGAIEESAGKPRQDRRGSDFNINVRTNAPSIDESGKPIISTTDNPGFIPDSLQQKIVSNTGSGSAAVTAYMFNEDVFTATATNNGSGASSVSNTYNDGFTGNGYNQLIKIANQGKGILCYGMTLTYIVTSGSAQDTAGLNSSNLNHNAAVLVGSGMRPTPMPMNQGTNYGQYQIGTMTVKRMFYVSALDQITYSVPVGDTVTAIVLTNPGSPALQ